ncbi:MAG: acyl carrier protein [Pseudomonadota bacterium]
MSTQAESRAPKEIADWCVQFVAKLVDMPAERVSVDAEFESFGLDSAATVSLVMELEEWLGRPVDAEVVFTHPTIASLALHLAGEPA